MSSDDEAKRKKKKKKKEKKSKKSKKKSKKKSMSQDMDDFIENRYKYRRGVYICQYDTGDN